MYELIILPNTFDCTFSKLYMSTNKRASKPRNSIIAPSKTYLLMPDLGHWTQLNFCIRIKSTSLKFISKKIVLLIRPASSIKLWKCIMLLKKVLKNLNTLLTKKSMSKVDSMKNVAGLWIFLRKLHFNFWAASCPDFLFFDLETSNFGYLHIFWLC